MSWDDSRGVDDAAQERLVSELTLDRRASTPLYRQVATRLREMIVTGSLVSGTPLPTEPKLARDIHVSRYTLRQAIDELAREGFIRRVHGRGNFVSRPGGAAPQTFWSGPGIDRDLMAHPQRVRILRVDYLAKPPEVSGHKVEQFPETVTEVVRMRMDAGAPLSVERIYIPGDPVAPVDTEMLSHQWITTLLERWHGVTPTHAREQLRLAQAEEETSTLLGISAGGVVFLRENLIFADERLLAIHRSYFPAAVSVDGISRN